MTEEQKEMISKQVQSAVAPFAEMIRDMKKELREVKEDNRTFNEEMTKKMDSVMNLIIGAKFLAGFGKVILGVGAIIGMFWALFVTVAKFK